VVNIKTEEEISLMKATCALAREALAYAGTLVRPGISTEEINQLVHEFIVRHGAYPSPLNYHGFPKSICTSLNEVICHGIPSSKDVLKSGDVLNIDVTTKLNGFHGDTNATFFVGEVSSEVKKLVEVAYQCMMAGISKVRPGGKTGDIGAAIEEIAKDHRYGVVQEYCGHGIGRNFHEPPQILHYGKKGSGIVIKEGMTFTVEPMINLGKRHCHVLDDGWTVITKDGSVSAQFEHTVLVTAEGFEILT
jgi:methionyl aminopeptidase